MRSSTASRSESRTRSGESTASCTTCRTNPPRRSSGNKPPPQGNLFLIGPLRDYHACLRRRQRGPVDSSRVAGPEVPRRHKKNVANDTQVSELDGLDGLVLSGGAPRVGVDRGKMGRNGEYLDSFDAPILGICAGHQFMAKHLGGDAAPAKVPEFGKSIVQVHQPDVLFEGLPNRFEVWEPHNDEVTQLPRDFVALASSENCDIQAMRHRDRPLFGLQFHPEVEHTQFGADIFRNFLKLCESSK